MEEEERRRRVAKLTKIIVVVVVAIVAVSVPTYIYLTFLQPKPVTGVPSFRYAETRAITGTDSGVTFSFNYETVTPPFKKAVIVLNVTSCTADGTLEVRPLAYRFEVKTTDTFPKAGEVSFTEKQLYDDNILDVQEGQSDIGFINWAFEGNVQFIIYIESESE